jgi:hypothetical protein
MDGWNDGNCGSRRRSLATACFPASRKWPKSGRGWCGWPRARVSERVRYLVTSLDATQADPQRVLVLSRGHWGIENRLFHVKDDSFGEDRHVLQSHTAGTTLSLLRTTALNLLRGMAPLWTEKTPLTARAEWVNGHPAAVLNALA